MPENTAHQISDPQESEFDELRVGEAVQSEGIIAGIARLLGKGIEEVKAAFALSPAATEKDYPVTDCRFCGKEFRIFDKHYGKKQTMCPACDDKEYAKIREINMRPEKLAAAKSIRQQEANDQQKKNDERKETVELVAQTVAQILPQLQKVEK